MQLKSLILMAALLLLPASQVLLVTSQAYAAEKCCMCGMCKLRCTCPGQSKACPHFCGDPKPAGDSMVDQEIKGVREFLLSSTATNPNATQRFLAPMRGIRRNFSPGLLDNVKDPLQFECPAVDDKYLQGNITFALADTQQ